MRVRATGGRLCDGQRARDDHAELDPRRAALRGNPRTALGSRAARSGVHLHPLAGRHPSPGPAVLLHCHFCRFQRGDALRRAWPPDRVISRLAAAAAKRRGSGHTGGGASAWRGHDWPTCLALGPRGELFVSQYRVRGLLQFARSPDGYAYRRTVAAGPRFVSPEGVVHAHGSLYLVSVDRGVISRLSPAGRVLAESLPFEHDGRFYVYWGMTRGPDGHLYLAAHESEGGSVPP